MPFEKMVVKDYQRELFYWMPCLGQFKMQFHKKEKEIKMRDDLDFMVRAFQQAKITFEKTHKHAQPNIEACYISASKFTKPWVKPRNPEAYEEAWAAMEEFWWPYWHDARVLTLDEIVEHPNITLRGKSAGFPDTNFGYVDKYECATNVDWRAEFQEDWDNLFAKTLFIVQVNGKKEILPSKKVLENRLRNVFCMPVKHSLAQQRLLADSHRKIQDYSLALWHALGFSPFFRGTHRLVMHFKMHPHGWEFDGDSWESQIHSDSLHRLSGIKFRCLRPEDQTKENRIRLENLYLACGEALIILPDGCVFLKGTKGAGGNPSGQVATAHDNTFYMLVVFCFITFLIIGDNDFQIVFANASVAVLGDDLTFTVSDWLNNKAGGNFGKMFAKIAHEELGLMFSSPCWDSRPGEDLGFLAMKFVYDEEHKCFTHRVNRDKMYSNLEQGGRFRTPPEILQRISGMRNVSWADPQIRAELAHLFVVVERMHELQYHDDPEWVTAKKSYVSDAKLSRLYYGTQPMFAQGSGVARLPPMGNKFEDIVAHSAFLLEKLF